MKRMMSLMKKNVLQVISNQRAGGKQAPGAAKSKTPVLDNFGRDITKLAESGTLDPIVGREAEIERVSQILQPS